MHDEHETGQRAWMLFIYRVPQEPPGRRTYVWRRLKELGAAYLQQAAAILPDRADVGEELAALQSRIADYGGEASLLKTISPNAGWEQQTIARFNQARDAEYAELHENLERLEDEIARESRRGKFTFAELEDLEADWDKIVSWRERIRARDFFEAAGWHETEAVWERTRASLDLFTHWVHAQPDTAEDHPLPEPGAAAAASPQGTSDCP